MDGIDMFTLLYVPWFLQGLSATTINVKFQPQAPWRYAMWKTLHMTTGHHLPQDETSKGNEAVLACICQGILGFSFSRQPS